MAERLIGKGLEVSIYEPAISRRTIHGANLRFIESNIRHIWKLLTPDLPQLVQQSSLIVRMKKVDEREYNALKALRADQSIIDFVGALEVKLAARTSVFAKPQPQILSATAG
jgi:GDP-mannose 6-dehydrogenase